MAARRSAVATMSTGPKPVLGRRGAARCRDVFRWMAGWRSALIMESPPLLKCWRGEISGRVT
jgi:hypothetical protein